MRSPYLTKSRFKLALECMTQLYYTGKRDVYSDKNLDDEFLLALAKGGYQVGQLAKYYFCDNPVKEKITIDTLDYEEALSETNRKLEMPGRIVIAEAAFRHKNLFVRVDLLIKEDNILHVYEVKAKSIDQGEVFLNKKGTALLKKWEEYLYDIAFQRFVITNALKDSGLQLKSHLLLVNKDVTTDIDGFHQFFKVYSEGGRIKVVIREGLTRKHLGTQILIPLNVDDICEKIENDFFVPTDFLPNLSFQEFIWKASEIYANDKRVNTSLGSKCKQCRFHTDENDPPQMRAGYDECWKLATGLPELNRAPVTELWNGLAGNRSFATELVRANKYFIDMIDEADIAPVGQSTNSSSGLTPHQRRMEQVSREKKRTQESYFDSYGLKREMDSWKFPLHMIDFETSSVAIPFFKGLRTYEGVAFQFSHHVIDESWNVRHATQFLSFNENHFPNFDFVRELKNALSQDDGAIFRYHNHENTYLRMIHRQLQSHPDSPDDRRELMTFIEHISHDSETGVAGGRDMIDLYDLVIRYYYSPIAKGSNSLKSVLPAIISESEFLKEKYGKPGFYGKGKKVPSLNFDDHVWIKPEVKFNPYKTLPRVFEEYDSETLDLLVKDFENVSDGGTAMTAFNYLQFSEIPIDQRKRISDALLKYCELDTLAMVMLVEAWKSKMT